MTALEERLRSAIRSYDPYVPGHRPLRVHEGRLPEKTRDPYGPDPVVFGPQRHADLTDSGGLITSRCKAHDVEWAGYGVPCWCCAAGVAPC